MSEMTLSAYNSSLSDSSHYAIQFFHRIPRLGLPNDLSLLASSNPVDKTTYMKGAALPAFCLLLVFICWSVILFCLWCAGSKVGFLSGAAFVVEKKSSSSKKVEVTTSNSFPGTFDTGNTLSQDEQQKTRRSSRYFLLLFARYLKKMPHLFKTFCNHSTLPRNIRCVSLFSGLLLCATLIVLSVMGTNGIEKTSFSLQSAGTLFQNRLVEGADITTAISTGFRSAMELRGEIYPTMDKYCKNEKSDISEVLKFNKNTVESSFITLNQYIESDSFKSLPGTFISVQGAEETINRFMTTVATIRPIVITVAIALFLLSLLLMTGVVIVLIKKSVLSHTKYLFFLDCIVMPLFALFIVSTYILSSLALMSGIVNADACYEVVYSGGSQALLNIALEHAEVGTNSFAHFVALKVAGDCNGPILNLEDKKQQVKIALQEIYDAIQTIHDKNENVLNQACPPTDFNEIRRMVYKLSKNFEVMLQSMQQAENLISCDALTPIYRKVARESICKYNIEFLVWVFSCLLFVSFCGMIMVTFRSSWKYDVVDCIEGENSLTLDTEQKVYSGPAVNVQSTETVFNVLQDTGDNASDSTVNLGYNSIIFRPTNESTAPNNNEFVKDQNAWDWDWDKPSLRRELS